MFQDSNGLESSDQRYFPRWEVNKRVLYEVERKPDVNEGQTRDISCTGMCISANEALTPGNKIKVVLFLTEADVIRLTGEIIWNKSFGKQDQMGISFSNISQKNQELILEHAFDVNRQQLINHWFKGWDGK